MRAFTNLRSRGWRTVFQKAALHQRNSRSNRSKRLEAVRMVIDEGLYTDVRLGQINYEAAEVRTKERSREWSSVNRKKKKMEIFWKKEKQLNIIFRKE